MVGIKRLDLHVLKCVIMKLVALIGRRWRFGGENEGGEGDVRRCWIVGA